MEAPVVTVVDPLHPGRFTPPPPPPARRTLRPVERVLATAVALLVVAGLSSSARLREQQRDAEALRDLRLSVAAVDAQVQGDEVDLLLLAASSRSVTVSALRGEGWSLRGDGRVPDRDLVGVTIRHALDCAAPLRVPQDLTATVDDGRVAGEVPVELRGVLPLVAQALRAACGDVDADEAVVLLGSDILRGPRETTVGLRLANQGVDPVTVLRARYPGFALVAGETLPVTLASRSSERFRAELRVVLQDCGKARAALDASRSSSAVDLLEVDVDGRGGRGTARLDVRGVVAYLEQAWQEGCG